MIPPQCPNIAYRIGRHWRLARHGSLHPWSMSNFAYNRPMAYIPYIEEPNAPEDLKTLYNRYRDPLGHVDNILKIHGPNPPSLEAHAKLYVTLMRGKSDLSKIQREMIAVVVSSINECHY